jgi:hypothetical protein
MIACKILPANKYYKEITNGIAINANNLCRQQNKCKYINQIKY